MARKPTHGHQRHQQYDEAYADLTIDPATIPGLSREAILLTKHKGKFQLFNQKVLAGADLNSDKQQISYRNPALLKQFISPIGNILPRRVSGVQSKQIQVLLATQIKRARQLAILHYPGHDVEPVVGDN